MSLLIGTIVPNNYFMPFQSVKSFLALGGRYPFTVWEGPDLDFNRNKIFAYAKHAKESLLMIDSDIVFTPEDVQQIERYLDEGFDAVTGLYVVGYPPYPPCVFERIPGDYKLTEPKEGMNEIGACGGGFLGISKRVIEAMPKDPFDNIREGDIFHGEDISFCHRLHENGFKLWCDSNIKVGHIRTINKTVV